ncbi:MAG: hypothetical protein SGJ21_06420 [Alphaproteobacteria bacterium]|nr:hypothetical protein [Alphaproteobacteria bacterium]
MSKQNHFLRMSVAALAAAAFLSSPVATAQGVFLKVQSPQNNELAGGPARQPQDWRGGGDDDRRYDDAQRGDDGDWRYGEDRRYGDDDWRGRRRAPDFQTVQASCSRAAIQEAWRTNAYSAQYDGAPRLVEGRRGYELVGRVRVHSRKGYTTGATVCELRGSDAVRFEYLR